MPWHNSTEFDIFYISFDEPDYKKNYADLLTKAPWAQHVHGVVGFDNAHKECARRSSTERFISVDGDNIVDEIKRLNGKVLIYSITNITTNVKQHMNYIDELAKLPIPLDRPVYHNKQNFTYDISNLLE